MRTFLKSGSSRVVARCAAILLLVLAASPFTAPFATCELTDSAFVMLVEDSASHDGQYAPAVSVPLAVFDLAPVLLLSIDSRIAEGFGLRESSPSLTTPLRL